MKCGQQYPSEKPGNLGLDLALVRSKGRETAAELKGLSEAGSARY